MEEERKREKDVIEEKKGISSDFLGRRGMMLNSGGGVKNETNNRVREEVLRMQEREGEREF